LEKNPIRAPEGLKGGPIYYNLRDPAERMRGRKEGKGRKREVPDILK